MIAAGRTLSCRSQLSSENKTTKATTIILRSQIWYTDRNVKEDRSFEDGGRQRRQIPSRRNVHRPQRPRFVGHYCQHLPASLMAGRRRPNHCQQRAIGQHRPLTASWDGRWMPLDATGLHQSEVQDVCSSKSRTMTLFSRLQIQCAAGMQRVLETDQASRVARCWLDMLSRTNEPFQ